MAHNKDCKNCGTGTAIIYHRCRVCELIDGDKTDKRVKWCDACMAYICDKHMPDVIRRGMAAIIDKTQKVISWLKGSV